MYKGERVVVCPEVVDIVNRALKHMDNSENPNAFYEALKVLDTIPEISEGEEPLNQPIEARFKQVQSSSTNNL